MLVQTWSKKKHEVEEFESTKRKAKTFKNCRSIIITFYEKKIQNWSERVKKCQII